MMNEGSPPLRTGELVREYFLGERHRVGKMFTLVTSAAVLLTAAVAWAACGGGGEAEPPAEMTSGTAPPPAPVATFPAPQALTVDLEIGGLGAGQGEVNEPAGLAIDAEGNLYVADLLNHRIQKFDPQGQFLAEVGEEGEGPGQFNEPWGVAVDAQGNIYVADTFNHRIQKFDPEFEFVLAFGVPASSLEEPEPDAFWGPRDVAIDGEGNVWVSDSGTGRAVKYTSDGTLVEAFGGLGSGQGEFIEPVGIEIDASGDIFMADSGNRRVQRFDRDFNFLSEYEIPGWSYVDPFVKPYIALLSDGGLIVSDPTQHKLFRLDGEGEVIATYEAEGVLVDTPRGVVFDGGGLLYVAEKGESVVRRLVLPGSGP